MKRYTPASIEAAYDRYMNDATMTNDEVVALFQKLVDTGRAFNYPAHVRRTARRLIEAGLVKYEGAFEYRRTLG